MIRTLSIALIATSVLACEGQESFHTAEAAMAAPDCLDVNTCWSYNSDDPGYQTCISDAIAQCGTGIYAGYPVPQMSGGYAGVWPAGLWVRDINCCKTDGSCIYKQGDDVRLVTIREGKLAMKVKRSFPVCDYVGEQLREQGSICTPNAGDTWSLETNGSETTFSKGY